MVPTKARISEHPKTAPEPGGVLLHPVALAAIGVLVVNDQILKHSVGGTITNKVSDFAGLMFFPLLVVAVVELIRPRLTNNGAVAIAAVVVTGAVFAAIKVSPTAARAYGEALGYLRWPFQAALHLARGQRLPRVRRVRIVPDLSDLVALVALVVPWWLASRRWMRGGRPEQLCR